MLVKTKLDWLELLWTIESSRRARSTRRRALPSQSQRQGSQRGLLGALQLRHSRRRIRDAGHLPGRVDDDCFPGVLMPDDPPIPLHRDLVAAVRQILVGHGMSVQDRGGPRRGLYFVHEREGQRGEGQDAGSTTLRGASDPRDRRIDPEAATLRYLAGSETEGALGETKES